MQWICDRGALLCGQPAGEYYTERVGARSVWGRGVRRGVSPPWLTDHPARLGPVVPMGQACRRRVQSRLQIDRAATRGGLTRCPAPRQPCCLSHRQPMIDQRREEDAMDREQFWALIEAAKTATGGDCRAQTAQLIAALGERPVDEVLAWDRIHVQLSVESYRRDLWAPPTVDRPARQPLGGRVWRTRTRSPTIPGPGPSSVPGALCLIWSVRTSWVLPTGRTRL